MALTYVIDRRTLRPKETNPGSMRDAHQTLTSDIKMSLIFRRMTVTAIWYQDFRSIIIVNPRLGSKGRGCDHYYKAGDMC